MIYSCHMASKKGTPPLAVTHPALAKQANGWDPNEVTAGSGRKLSWKCLKGHIYLMAIYNRTGKPEESCPICSNHQVLVGYNDLATTHPEIAKEADGWDPTTVTAGSNKKLRWKCSNSHTYESTITSRTKTGNSCAICVNQRVLVGYNDLATTHPAVAIIADGWDPTTVVWGSNKKKQWKCVKGHSFEASINSITSRSAGCSVCAGKQILVGYNDLATTHPEIALEADGWDPRTVTAGSNSKQSWKCKKGHVYRVDPNHRVGQGGGCPFCSGRQVLAGFNDLATTHPEIALEADGWDPTIINAGSHKKLPWKCPAGHNYESVCYSRTMAGNSCPYCANLAILVGYNDLATTHPEIAKEADGWDPTTVVAGTGVKKDWKCKKGHQYKSSVHGRSGERATGCPYCANLAILVGYNDLATTHPEIAKEADGWDPTTVVAGTAQKRKWKCKNGHASFEQAITNRTGQGNGCPSCASSGFDPGKDAWLYFMRHEEFNYLQIGITNQPEVRLKTHERLGWELLEIRGPMDGHLCARWEKDILRMLRAKGANMGPSKAKIKVEIDNISKVVHTEMWSYGSFPVTSIIELMRHTEDYEENQGINS